MRWAASSPISKSPSPWPWPRWRTRACRLGRRRRGLSAGRVGSQYLARLSPELGIERVRRRIHAVRQPLYNRFHGDKTPVPLIVPGDSRPGRNLPPFLPGPGRTMSGRRSPSARAAEGASRNGRDSAGPVLPPPARNGPDLEPARVRRPGHALQPDRRTLTDILILFTR